MEEFERNGTDEEVKPSQPIWLSPKRSRTPPLRETSLTNNNNPVNPLRNKFNSYISPIEQSTDSQTFITQDNNSITNFMSFSDRLKAVESSSNDDEIDFEDQDEKENYNEEDSKDTALAALRNLTEGEKIRLSEIIDKMKEEKKLKMEQQKEYERQQAAKFERERIQREEEAEKERVIREKERAAKERIANNCLIGKLDPATVKDEAKKDVKETKVVMVRLV